MRVCTWKVLDFGDVPTDARQVTYTCLGCGRGALLPVLGVPLAQLEHGIVFDGGPRAIPKIIQCRRCRRTYERS